jgi:uncharacterized membrane protein YedE/YeeE
MEWLEMDRWSPYIVGTGIGLLSWCTFLLSDKPIGASTAFARTSGMIARLFRGSRVLEQPYYKIFPPVIDWEWMFVIGIIIGAFVSAYLSGIFHIEWVPVKWAGAFGPSPIVRWIGALTGGILIGVGSRWAGGCTSGHGISGTLQLAVSSWLAVTCFFVGGMATASFIFHIVH